MTQYPCVKCWGTPCHCAGDFANSPSLVQLERMSNLQLELLRDSINRLLSTRKQTVVYTVSTTSIGPIKSTGTGYVATVNSNTSKG